MQIVYQIASWGATLPGAKLDRQGLCDESYVFPGLHRRRLQPQPLLVPRQWYWLLQSKQGTTGADGVELGELFLAGLLRRPLSRLISATPLLVDTDMRR